MSNRDIALRREDELLAIRRRHFGAFGKAILALFVLWSTQMLVEGNANNLTGQHPRHAFTHIVQTTEYVMEQPLVPLVTHGIAGSVFLLTSIAQVFLPVRVYARAHRAIGKACLASSAVVSTASLFMAARALHYTGPMYVLAAVMWVFFTFMTWLTVKRRDFVAHRVWAHSLFSVGVMFTSTRAYILVLNVCGAPPDLSYFVGVMGAGVTAISYMIWQESSIDKSFPEGRIVERLGTASNGKRGGRGGGGDSTRRLSVSFNVGQFFARATVLVVFAFSPYFYYTRNDALYERFTQFLFATLGAYFSIVAVNCAMEGSGARWRQFVEVKMKMF